MSKLVQGRWVEEESDEPDPSDAKKKKMVKRWLNGGVLCVHTSNRHVNLVQPVIKICENAEWDDWNDRDDNGRPKKKHGLKWIIGKDEGSKQEGLGHFGSEYILVARDQQDLPPYPLTARQEALYKENGIMPVAFSAEEENKYKAAGLTPFRSSIEWLAEGSTSKYMAYYRYMPPPGTREWTDNYSNVLSVFRWN
jgi:hypothetical protein